MEKPAALGLGARVAIASILIPCGIAVFLIGVETLQQPPQHAIQTAYVTNGSLGRVLPTP